MEFRDYYKVIGVARDATADEIRKAYRKLARKYHPDVSKEPDADERMKEINEAYAVLSDTEKRAAYDQLGSGYQRESLVRSLDNAHRLLASPAAKEAFSAFLEKRKPDFSKFG